MSNWELGFRLRGFTYNIDWTLLYINHLYPVRRLPSPEQ